MRILMMCAMMLSFSPLANAGASIGLVSVWVPKPDRSQCQMANKAESQKCLATKLDEIFDQAKAWYQNVLGFNVVADIRGNFSGVAGRWIELQMPDQPDLKLVLKAGKIVRNDVSFSIAPDGSDALCLLYDNLKMKGARFHPQFGKPVRWPWALDFIILDPFGTQIEVGIQQSELSKEDEMIKSGKLSRTTSCETIGRFSN